MTSDFDRRETTAELSEKALKRLRKEFNLVSSEVWVDEAHRVDFVAYRIGTGYTNAAAERGTFCFVEVKSCMDDFTSGHGRTFEGDENWLVCPRKLADALHEKLQLPRNCKVLCPDAAGQPARRVRHQRSLAKLQEAFDRSVAAPNGVGQRPVVAHVARGFLRGGTE